MRFIAALAIVVGLASCGGGGDHKSASTARTSPAPNAGGGGGRAPTPAPQGRLTPAEYRAIVTEYRRLQPLQQRSDSPQALAQGRRACAALQNPNTLLVIRVRTDCTNAITFFIALNNLEQAGSDCTGSERDRIICGRNRYDKMAKAIRTTTAGGVAINSELSRRRITGLCADSIGMTQAQVASYQQAEQAARDAVDAISVADAFGFERAQNELADALDAGAQGDPLSGIEKACKPASAPPAQPAPQPKTPQAKPKPKQKSKPLPKIPDSEGGIKA